MGKRSSVLLIAAAGIFGALTFVVTCFLGIPYAGGAGYFSFGDALILLATALFGPIVGLSSSFVGGALADLVKGYGVFIPSTLLSKSLLILGAWGVMFLLRKKPKLAWVGFFVGGILMPLGYLPIYAALYPEAMWVAFGFDCIQGLGCALAAALLFPALGKALKAIAQRKD